MDTNKILSASILDLIFDNRNKEYGAYELRNTYLERIIKALIITSVVLLVFIAVIFLSKSPGENSERIHISEGYDLAVIRIDESKPVIPALHKKLATDLVKTIILTTPVIVDKTVLDRPLATVEEAANAQIGTENSDGMNKKGIVGEETDGTSKEVKPIKKEPEEPVSIGLQREAKFSGSWENFLRRNLNANVPADNGARAGNHTIIIQFVVDIEGNVSDIKPITNLGYGMEQEAIRVLRKATKWEPAIQNGRAVKAYRRQPITFQVLAE